MPLMLITGGAGFIGTNSAFYFASQGWQIVILDNLSRQGSSENLSWLQKQINLKFEKADIRDRAAVDRIVLQNRPDVILHLAAQVAVTTSITNPREDFEINAIGTLNVLEAIRLLSPETFLINASTNKVYGKMENTRVIEENNKYILENFRHGVDEEQPLDFRSPYGCSKGTADSYTREYSSGFGLNTVTFRQSCIYGTRQFGCDDQGWVAWFVIAAIMGKQLTIFGDGKQSRDVLWVDDLVRAYDSAIKHRKEVSGQTFNIGGGQKNTISLLGLITQLENILQKPISISWGEWRSGDQLAYSSNIAKAKQLLNWEPSTPIATGILSLVDWVRGNINLTSISPEHNLAKDGEQSIAE